ncbi:MAG: DNRLRE domain-containing protein [Armatimonadetes bacterium]|nr:DNRLRE domain-containing protein [Armatimonadota bacterium]
MVRWAVIGIVLVSVGLLTGCGGNDIGGGQQQLVLEPMDDETGMGALALLNLLPAADTFINQGAPGVNYGGSGALHCGNYPRGTCLRPMLRFDLTKIPKTATINKAQLRLYVLQVNQGTDVYKIHRVTQPWDEMGATWATHNAAYAAGVLSSRTIGPAQVNTTVNFPLVGLVQTWVKDPARNYGLMIKGTEGAARIGVVFASRQNLVALRRPRLYVDYTP